MRVWRVLSAAMVALAGTTPVCAESWSGLWIGAAVGGGAYSWGEGAQGRSSVSISAEAGYNLLADRLLLGIMGRVTHFPDSIIGTQYRAGTRIGVLALDDLLFHIGGGAINGTRAAQYSYFQFLPTPASFTQVFNGGRGFGYYLSVGAEYKFSSQWSAGVEYSFSSLSGFWSGRPPRWPLNFTPTWPWRVQSQTQDIQVSLRYRF